MNRKQLNTKNNKKQKGFTLIEIIAVLVVLAVLALVAVPQYNNTVAQARNAAAQQAVAEGMARLSTWAAQQILANGAVPARAAAVATGPMVSGDYNIALADGTAADEVDITATGPNGGSAVGTWTLPQI